MTYVRKTLLFTFNSKVCSCKKIFFQLSAHFAYCHENISRRVCNPIHWGLARHNSNPHDSEHILRTKCTNTCKKSTVAHEDQSHSQRNEASYASWWHTVAFVPSQALAKEQGGDWRSDSWPCVFAFSHSRTFFVRCGEFRISMSSPCISQRPECLNRRFTRRADFQTSRTRLQQSWPYVSGSVHTRSPCDCARRLACIEMSHLVRYR